MYIHDQPHPQTTPSKGGLTLSIFWGCASSAVLFLHKPTGLQLYNPHCHSDIISHCVAKQCRTSSAVLTNQNVALRFCHPVMQEHEYWCVIVMLTCMATSQNQEIHQMSPDPSLYEDCGQTVTHTIQTRILRYIHCVLLYNTYHKCLPHPFSFSIERSAVHWTNQLASSCTWQVSIE